MCPNCWAQIGLIFLGLLDKILSWKEHIKYNKNETAKNLGLLYKPKHYLEKRSLLVLYYSFIHIYINYGNIAWNKSKTYKNMPSGSYIVKTDLHMQESYFKKAKF